MMSALAARMEARSFIGDCYWSASWRTSDYMSEWRHMAMVMWNGCFSTSWDMSAREEDD